MPISIHYTGLLILAKIAGRRGLRLSEQELDAVLEDYYCGDCRVFVTLRLRDVLLPPSATPQPA